MAGKDTVFDNAEIARRLQNLPGWAYDGGSLRREYVTDGWKSTMLVVNAIAALAEMAGHHPDLHVSWSRITVKLWTHSAKGITAKDFAAAQAIEAGVRWAPAADSPLANGATSLVQPD